MLQQTSSARILAAQVLVSVDADGAFANLELDKRLRQSALAIRDRALATELVYGAIRWQGLLDHLIGRASSRPPESMAPAIRAILRMTAYQLLFLEHIPAHAAVHEAVEAARQLRQPAAAGFVNAVSRRIAREGMPKMDGATADPETLATLFSHPAWLVRRWISTYGIDATRRILAVDQAPAPLVLRVNTLRSTRVACLEAFRRHDVEARAGFAPDAVIVGGGVAVAELPGYAEGWFTVQDESSQLVAYALDPRAGESIADMCSAPGGKATHMAQLMEDQGEIVAMDLHPHRAQLVARTARRLGLRSVRAAQRDSRVVPEEWRNRFHRVLLDAPCSGTGVLRRRVDLRWRIQEKELQSLAQTQTELLDAAAAMLGPGGVLVYSTCSIEPEENGQRTAGFLAAHPDFTRGSLERLFTVAPALAAIPHLEPAPGELQLLPDETHDGFFLSVMTRLRGECS